MEVNGLNAVQKNTYLLGCISLPRHPARTEAHTITSLLLADDTILGDYFYDQLLTQFHKIAPFFTKLAVRPSGEGKAVNVSPIRLRCHRRRI